MDDVNNLFSFVRDNQATDSMLEFAEGLVERRWEQLQQCLQGDKQIKLKINMQPEKNNPGKIENIEHLQHELSQPVDFAMPDKCQTDANLYKLAKRAMFYNINNPDASKENLEAATSMAAFHFKLLKRCVNSK